MHLFSPFFHLFRPSMPVKTLSKGVAAPKSAAAAARGSPKGPARPTDSGVPEDVASSQAQSAESLGTQGTAEAEDPDLEITDLGT
jgi:hypothetical protein